MGLRLVAPTGSTLSTGSHAGPRYHSKVQGTGLPSYNTMCAGCTTAIQSKSTHQLCASQRVAGELMGCYCRVVERRAVLDNVSCYWQTV